MLLARIGLTLTYDDWSIISPIMVTEAKFKAEPNEINLLSIKILHRIKHKEKVKQLTRAVGKISNDS